MRWIVGPGDGPTVGRVLARAGVDERAVAEGRVFVFDPKRRASRRRVRGDTEMVSAGEVVEVAAASGSAAASHDVRILLRERDLVAADKPAGIPTIADHAGASHALVARVAHVIGVDPERLHPTSRLDRGVSGVVVFTLTREAAARLAAARESGGYHRRYAAIASASPQPARGAWTQPIGRASDPRLRAVHGRDPVAAETRYAVAARAGSYALLALAPVTGRTHQIRVHAAHAGAALVGDRDYAGPARLVLPGGRVVEPGRIALHAWRVVVPAAAGRAVAVTSPFPPELVSLWSALGGEAAAWEGLPQCEPGS
jgi:23S rRNA-/tRNA-specific pseudouridylate synthase